jgi:hypothetical protein
MSASLLWVANSPHQALPLSSKQSYGITNSQCPRAVSLALYEAMKSDPGLKPFP